MPKKVIISGGGTGGHIYPAVAIANALKELEPTIEILFVGALGKMEMEKVPKAGFPIVGLPIVGIKRELSLDNLAFPVKLVKSLFKAKSVIKDFAPDIAIGVGGFASGPVLMVASLMGIPTLIQEQNSYAGITNKLLAKRAKKICVAYPGMDIFFPKEKIKFLGNPVRNDILDIASKRDEAIRHFDLTFGKKTIFVMGGSLGARSVNQSILKGVSKFVEAGYQVLWQTGKGFIDTAVAEIKARNLGDSVKAYEFIYEMDLAYAVSDIVISRAGALSVSEICLVAKPSILVPFPAASEDHQTKNALSLVEKGAAILVKDAETDEKLVTEALNLLNDTSKQTELIRNVKPLARPTAAKDIAREILQLIN